MANQQEDVEHITLTSDAEWNPYSSTFAEKEQPFLPSHQHYTYSDEFMNATYDFAGNRLLCATSSMDHCSSVSPEHLAWQWGTSVMVATHTLKVTTQRGIRFITKDNLSRQFRTRQAQLGHKWLRTAVYSDTMFSDIKSIRGNTCAQVYVTDQLYSRVYPMKSKADAFVTLNDFAHNVGIPNPIITDNAREETDAQ